jgi:hypothetical protein
LTASRTRESIYGQRVWRKRLRACRYRSGGGRGSWRGSALPGALRRRAHTKDERNQAREKESFTFGHREFTFNCGMRWFTEERKKVFHLFFGSGKDDI